MWIECSHVLLIVLSVHKDLPGQDPPPFPCESREESHVTQSHNDWSAETTLFLTLVAPCFSDWIMMLGCWVHVKRFASLVDHLPQNGFIDDLPEGVEGEWVPKYTVGPVEVIQN